MKYIFMTNKRFLAAFVAIIIGAGTYPLHAGPRNAEYKQALELYQNGMYERARDIFDSLKDQGDAVSEGYSVLCSAKLKSDGYEQAMDSYLAKYPESSLAAQIHLQHGFDFFDRGDYESARSELSKFSKDDIFKSQLAEYVFKRAYCDYGLGCYESARKRFTSVEKMPASDYTAPSRYAIGYIDYSNSEFDSAIKWFELAARDPRFSANSNYYILECRFNNKDYKYVTENGPAMFNTVPLGRRPHLARIISESYLVQGDVEKAKEYYDINQISDEEKSRSDYFYAGSMLYALEDYQGALDNFGKMSFRNDSLGQIASYQMADSYLQLKNKVAAMDAFKEASDLTFDADIQEDAFFNYAKLAYDLNQDGQAFSDYIAKYSKSKRGDDIYTYMALSRLAAHDYAGAVEAYDNIDELSPDMRSNYMKANYLRANQLISSGSWRDAIQCLQASAFYTGRRDPFNQLSRYWLAESYYNTGKYKEAGNVLEDLYNNSALDGHAEGKVLLYNLAYSCFRDEDYQSAAKWFDKFIASGDKDFLKDAMVRRADCDFLVKDYKAAAAGYENVLARFDDADDLYSCYQLGLSYGLNNEKKKKAAALERVNDASPDALLYPETMYELGRAYVDMGSSDKAVKCFETLKDNSKDGTYVAKSLIELGMISRNKKDYDKALSYYKQVVEDLPKNELSADALLAIESIYQSMGEPEKYLAYSESIGNGGSRTEEEKEQIYFNSAEQIFLSGNYQKAIVAIQKYLETYPSGSKKTEAVFYAAESYLQLGQKENAADGYAKVMTASDAGPLLEPAALNYADISFGLEHFQDAYNGYSILKDKARMAENVLTAKAGMMRSAYKAKNFRNAIDASESLKSDSGCTEALSREADYIKAKSLMGSSRRSAAMDIFKELASSPSTDEGAEAAYLLIQSTYDEGGFDKVEKMVYDFSAKAEGQNYWLAKAFIVLGDAFAEQDNTAQAKATFESVANGYEPQGPEDDVLDNVKMRLEKLSQLM